MLLGRFLAKIVGLRPLVTPPAEVPPAGPPTEGPPIAPAYEDPMVAAIARLARWKPKTDGRVVRFFVYDHENREVDAIVRVCCGRVSRSFKEGVLPPDIEQILDAMVVKATEDSESNHRLKKLLAEQMAGAGLGPVIFGTIGDDEEDGGGEPLRGTFPFGDKNIH